MEGKICLVTGATSGIGEATALELARLGATVVVGARTPEKALATVERLKRETGNPAIDYLLADLSVQSEVRDLARQFQARHDRLDVLVNNAGAIYLWRALSADGIEMTFAGNHLAYFLLTNLLLETLKASAPARVVNVASNAHEGASIDFGDLQMEHGYAPMRAYGQSKLANILFTYELSRRLNGAGVTVNTLHPGLVATNMGSNNGWLVAALAKVVLLAAISPPEGASTGVYLATSPEVEGVTGRYYYQGRDVPSDPVSYDEETARRLWQVSAEMTGLPLGGP